jgi:hypothetical protein
MTDGATGGHDQQTGLKILWILSILHKIKLICCGENQPQMSQEVEYGQRWVSI